jgi:hypothetical protein
MFRLRQDRLPQPRLTRLKFLTLPRHTHLLQLHLRLDPRLRLQLLLRPLQLLLLRLPRDRQHPRLQLLRLQSRPPR